MVQLKEVSQILQVRIHVVSPLNSHSVCSSIGEDITACLYGWAVSCICPLH